MTVARRIGAPLQARLVATFALAVALIAACGGRPAAPDVPESWPAIRVLEIGSTDPASVGGTWAQLQITTSETRVPLAGTVTSTRRALLLLKMSQEGADVTVRGEVCELEIDSGSSMAATVIPEAFVRSLSPRKRRARLDETPDGLRFLQMAAIEIQGAALSDPEDPLPTELDDPRVLDSDGDGAPGVTVEVTGITGGRLFFVQRVWRELESRSVTPTTIDGVVRWGSERSVLDATNRMLRAQRESNPTSDPSENYFRTTRVVDDSDCAAIIEAGPGLFER